MGTTHYKVGTVAHLQLTSWETHHDHPARAVVPSTTTWPPSSAAAPPGYSLEAPFYTSQEVFDLDMAAIWTKHWLFVAAEAEVPEPGDYVTVEVGPSSVIIVRDDDEEVRAFHNVCRHRGSRILDDACGSVGNLVCPYHHWTYSVDGRLLHAENQPATFDRSRFGLKPVHVRNVAGLVFICLADEPPADFDEVAARIEPYLAPYELGRTKVAHQIDIIEQGNWKLVMENNRECYHCDGHPELLTAYFPLHGYTAEDVPPRLRRVWDRFEKATADLRGGVRPAGLPDRGDPRARRPADRLHDRARPARRRREVLHRGRRVRVPQAAGSHRRRPASATCTCTCSRTRGSTCCPTMRWCSPCCRSGRTGPSCGRPGWCTRTPWRASTTTSPTLTHVWSATNAQDSAFVARTQRGWRTPATSPVRTRRSRATSTPSSPGTSPASAPTCR